MNLKENIPNAISSWALANNVLLLTDDRLPTRSYFYISSSDGATFQIVIEPVKSEKARIDAHLIEGPEGEEAHFIWEFPWSRIRDTLDLSLKSSYFWFEKMQRPENKGGS